MHPPADTDGGEVAELLLPPNLDPDRVRPLQNGRTLTLSGETMGTGWNLSAVVPPEIDDTQIVRALEQRFTMVIAQMSQWEPESEISRFNRAAPGSSLPLSRPFAHVLDCALVLAQVSDGAFDPTLGAASDLWGFGAAPAPAAMPGRETAKATRKLNWRDVAMSHNDCTLVQPGGLQLDLSAIAKGFAVDFGIDALEQIGVRHALLEIGGELRGIGVQADGQPWWVDLDIPPDSDAPTARIGLCGWAIATSGNYRRRREADARSWSHSLDPQTGIPVADDVLSVSVLHTGCMQADGLATLLLILGPERAMHFADTRGIPVRMVTDKATIASRAWKAWLH